MKRMRYPEAAAITVETVTARAPRREITALRDRVLIGDPSRSAKSRWLSVSSCHRLAHLVGQPDGFRARRRCDQGCKPALAVALDGMIDDDQQQCRDDERDRKKHGPWCWDVLDVHDREDEDVHEI